MNLQDANKVLDLRRHGMPLPAHVVSQALNATGDTRPFDPQTEAHERALAESYLEMLRKEGWI